MGKSVNKALLLGNVTRDPEIKTTGSGTAVANFSIATNDRVKDAQGNWQDKPEYHNLVAFGRTAEIVRDYVKKGGKVYVEGRITQDTWEKDGVKQYRTKIIVNELVLLSGKSDYQTPANQTSNEVDEADIPFWEEL